ncbi:uncharacterized protein BDR25DRAFT_300262 [Lindgomyces ingoldianus]|uniref:Uncharacterized protein n=1 Tax=Lindgomyces ingoldianus TaxID=673940 RepID=A0ACB6RD63_9PLEO|nr:uncharacterized protein BDR25DRAFT_300262 [Lindgomyces ingoldianus]KAF2477274.1 hypothetical protein BDR25DRAFT_300262 [Lindgomyces ingoldianus]
MSTHLPLRVLRRPPGPSTRQCIFFPQPVHSRARRPPTIPTHLYRNISSTPAFQKTKPLMDPSQIRAATKNQKSMAPASAIQEQIDNPDFMPDEHGLLPGTIIRPSWRELPNPFTEPKNRAYYEWRWLKARITDLFSRFVYKFRVRKGKGRPKLSRKSALADAKVAYEEMWKRFADKDEKALQEICLSSIMKPLITHLAARPATQTITWRLLKHHRSPVIVSNRSYKFSQRGFEESAMRQITIRFRTRQLITTYDKPKVVPTSRGKQKYNPLQSLARPANINPVDADVLWTPSGPKPREEVEGDGGPSISRIEKDVDEYVVFQRMMKRGKEEEWKIWGWATPTDLKSIKEEDEFMRKMEEFNLAHPDAV